MEDYSIFLRREISGLVRRELDIMFQDELRDVEVTLPPRIEHIMIDLQPRLLRMFQESEVALDEEPGVPEPQQAHQNLALSGASLQNAHSDADLGSTFNYPDDLEQGWDRDPSVSDSAVTLFPDAFFDISSEKLLDPTFASAEMGYNTAPDGSHRK